MKAELRRLNADYTCWMRSPILALADRAPSALALAYQTFASRYPDITASDFRVLSSDRLADRGVQVTLLGGLIQIDIRVEQIYVRIRSLCVDQDINFAKDVIVIAHDFAHKLDAASELGEGKLEIGTWTNLGGPALVDRLFEKSAVQQGVLLPNPAIEGVKVLYPPCFRILDTINGWSINVKVDYSVYPDSDVFVFQEYSFLRDGNTRDIEDRLRVVDETTESLGKWLFGET
ncbi:MAG: hypothetical protein SF002_10345 [Alphaproteobacteria bacterium]|nr:hypothetical protein [Alphaproteobacteria bacterium]